MSKPYIDKIKEKVSKKQKEEKDMKIKNILNIVKDVAFIALVSIIIGIFAGIQYQKGQETLVKNEAASIVKNVKVQATVTPSK